MNYQEAYEKQKSLYDEAEAENEVLIARVEKLKAENTQLRAQLKECKVLLRR
jgi:predicted nuclease with TOPRIM domain